jgi:hypothetical protein
VGLRNADEGKGDDRYVFYLRPTVHLWKYELLRMMQTGELRFGRGVQFSDDWKDIVKSKGAEAQADMIADLKPRLPANPKDVPRTRCERPLDTAVAQHIATAWIGVLRETRYPPAEPSFHLDGTAYHFSADLQWEGVFTGRALQWEIIIAGQTWSPPQDSKPGRLAELAKTLVRYCDGKAEATELERQATELAERLNK